jgi:hypothetical protein
MSDEWKTVPAAEVQVGDVVRFGNGTVITVTRIEAPFLERAEMLAFIEDTPERWLKCPASLTAHLEVNRQCPPS